MKITHYLHTYMYIFKSHRKQEATSFQTEVDTNSVWNAESYTQKYINRVIRKTGTREESSPGD